MKINRKKYPMESLRLYKAVDGTFIDLSRVVAISPVKRLSADYGVCFGFDILFIPGIVPFKQQVKTFSITIQKEYRRPKELITYINPGVGYNEEGMKIFNEFLISSEKEMETHRIEMYDVWQKYIAINK